MSNEDRLRELGRELFFLAEKLEPRQNLSLEDLWRYHEIGEVFAPDYFVSGPQA